MVKVQSKSERKRKLIPYETICLAANGDAEAMQLVLEHYDGYIKALATERLSDGSGGVYTYFDEALYSRLQMKLIVTVMKFDTE